MENFWTLEKSDSEAFKEIYSSPGKMCQIYILKKIVGLTIQSFSADDNTPEGISIINGKIGCQTPGKRIFQDNYLIHAVGLPSKVKKLFAGNFNIQIWQPYRFDPAYKLPIGYITEEEKRSCKIGINQNTIQIFATEDGVAQTITIKDGKIIFDDGENGGEFSCQVFTKYFAELAKDLPDEVKKLFGGCYGV